MYTQIRGCMKFENKKSEIKLYVACNNQWNMV